MVSMVSPVGAMPPPSTPMKRPALGHKRDSSYVDTDDDIALSSSTKKLKVAFDPNVDVRILDDYTDKSFDLVKEEVRQAIDKHLAPGEKKDDTPYTKLVQQLDQDAFSSDALTSKLLKKYILAIDARVSSLRECGKLVMAVLDIAWLGRDETFTGIFIKFLTDLASAHAKFAQPILERLIPAFSKLPSSLGRLPEETTVPRTRMFARLHLVIRTLLRQIPHVSNVLMRVLKSEFPNDLETTRAYLQYEKHLLRLAGNIPELKAEILALIVQRLVNTDVQIQKDIEDFAEEAEEKLLQKPASSTGDDAAEDVDESDDDSVSDSELTMTEEELRIREVRLRIAKMDGTLDSLFEHYTPLVDDESQGDTNNTFRQLLSHFTDFILPNRTRHAQFLIFHFSQTSPAHTASFIQHCLEIVANETGSLRHRLTACAYLASFVARGSHISSKAISEIFNVLCHYLDDIRRRYEPNCRGPDRRNYSLYYAVAQAVVYIFCFRWRNLVVGSTTPEQDSEEFNEDEVLAEGRDLAWQSGIKDIIQRNIYCRLNPLKVCSPDIVSEFAGIANHLRFLYVFPLLETNKRVRLGQLSSYYGSSGLADIGRRETAWDRKKGEAHHQLEAYFPFDPYNLPKSKRWVANDYNQWKLPTAMRGDDDEGDGSDEDEEEEASDAESISEEEVELPLARPVSMSA